MGEEPVTEKHITNARDRATRKYKSLHAALKAEVEAMREEDVSLSKRDRKRLASEEHRMGQR